MAEASSCVKRSHMMVALRLEISILHLHIFLHPWQLKFLQLSSICHRKHLLIQHCLAKDRDVSRNWSSSQPLHWVQIAKIRQKIRIKFFVKLIYHKGICFKNASELFISPFKIQKVSET